MNLFEHADRYPKAPGYARGSDTSKEAADKLTQRTVIHEAILRALTVNSQGLIVDDAKRFLESYMGRKFDRSTIAARFTELEKLGRIIMTDEKQKTPMGRNAHVYKISV